MTWIDLGNPAPRSAPEAYALFKWPTGEIKRLPVGLPPGHSFHQVIENRTTEREFGDMDDSALGALLWHSCRSRDLWPSTLGFDLEHRAAPSAGGIHPIHVVLCRPVEAKWWLYQPQGHYLVEIVGAAEKLGPLYAESVKVLPSSQAVRLLFLAEPGKVFAKYQNACSLIWRDAGALLALIALTAQAQGLNFCPLGITGEPWASSLSNKGQLVGVGLGLLGLASTS